MSEYPEHDKMIAAKLDSEPQGQLLEWLSSQGVHLMVWGDLTDVIEEHCRRCHHWSDSMRVALGPCEKCGTEDGVIRRPVRREGWVPYGKSIPQILADLHGIDLSKVEKEKRVLLERQREANAR